MLRFNSIRRFFFIALLVGFVVVVLCLIASCNNEDSKSSFGSDVDARAMATIFIEKELKDPDSVKYENTRIYSMMLEGGRVKMYTVCGKINAKNGFGGYTGFHDFVATVGFDKDGKEVPFVRNVFLEPSSDFVTESCHNGL